MAKFKVVFEREVICVDRLVRIIEAENEELAREHAGYLASDFNCDCPDDTQNDISQECESWEECEIALASPDEIETIPEGSSDEFLADQPEAAQ